MLVGFPFVLKASRRTGWLRGSVKSGCATVLFSVDCSVASQPYSRKRVHGTAFSRAARSFGDAKCDRHAYKGIGLSGHWFGFRNSKTIFLKAVPRFPLLG